MKKRIISLALALVLTLALAAPVLAEEEPTADAAPTQRIKEIHLTWISVTGSTNDVIYGYSYDNGGVLPSSESNGYITDTYTYDDEGRITLSGGQGHGTTTYTYDEDGRLAEMKHDSDTTYTYQYDEDGRLQGYTIAFNDDTEGFEVPSLSFDDDGRVTEVGGTENKAYTYAPQLRIGYCSPSLAESIINNHGGFDLDSNSDFNATYLQLDVLDAAGTPINFYDVYGGWAPPIDMTYDDAGYLTHMESSNGCTADFTYEPVA